MTTRKVLALSALLAASQIHAQPVAYNVTGSMTTMNTIGATVDPTLTLASWPTFIGAWIINRSVPSVIGTFADFNSYTTSISAGLFGTAAVNQSHLVYLFNGGGVTYTPDATGLTGGTLTVGTPMTCPIVDSSIHNAQTSSAMLRFDTVSGATSTCTGSLGICNAHATHFASKPDLERFYLTLTFNSSFTGFTGTAVGADIGGAVTVGNTGNTWYCYSFSGS